jgi:hypothetical protein
MRASSIALLILSAGLLQACAMKSSKIVSPESLIDRSAERVTFSLAAPSARQDITEWLIKDVPSRAELQCDGGDSVCAAIAAELDRRNVPVDAMQAGGQPRAVLVYERYAARACDNTYRDNSFNPLNSTNKALGCSVSQNLLQSVADGDQFTNPPMMGNAYGNQAVKAVRKAQK